MDQAILRLLIREKLATGCLPRHHTPQIWGGPGNGETCDGCGGTVTRPEMLMEGALDALGCGVRFHVACFALWDAERQRPADEPSGPTSPAMAPPKPAMPESSRPRCPACQSERITPMGHIMAAAGRIKSEQRCAACGIAFFLVRTTFT